jgi:hypothetical protein
MSIVSSQLGFIDAPVLRRKPNVAVQYAKNDSGEPEPMDFTLPAVMPNFNNVNPSGGCMTGIEVKGEDIPLKYRQYNSGMAMFNAPSVAATAQLDVPDDYPVETAAVYKGQHVSFPEPAPFNYNMGIRAGPRALYSTPLDEPAPAILYRRPNAGSKGIPSAKASDGISYDVGIEELRAMIERHIEV